MQLVIVTVAVPLQNVLELLNQSFVSIGNPDVGNICASDVITCWPLLVIVDPQPVLLHLRESGWADMNDDHM